MQRPSKRVTKYGIILAFVLVLSALGFGLFSLLSVAEADTSLPTDNQTHLREQYPLALPATHTV